MCPQNNNQDQRSADQTANPIGGSRLSHQEQTHQGREVKQEDADLVGGHSTVMDRVKGLPRQAEPTGMQPIEPSSHIAAMPPQITTRACMSARDDAGWVRV